MKAKFSKHLGLGKLSPSEALGRQLSQSDQEKAREGGLVDTPIPWITWRSFIMGVFVSMGGFIFGYDTGQISGVLEMKDFLRRFGEPNASGDGYHFTHVRAGLIVAMVCFLCFIFSKFAPSSLVFWSLIVDIALYWDADWCIGCCTCCRQDWTEVVNVRLVCDTFCRCDCSNDFRIS